MKLKALPNRLYNIFFHTHTVTGIVIGFALFIIFYAGAFSLFKDEIYQWENQQARIEPQQQVNYDDLIDALKEKNPNLIVDDHLTIVFPSEHIPMIRVYAEVEQADSSHKRFLQYINPNTLEISEKIQPITTVGDTLYHLHYFQQIPLIGLYLSGFVSLFFLFATITGILIHWKNLSRKFYAYTTEGKWKTIWTNAHTVLGVITIPFQIIFAVTGALFGLLLFLLAPSAIVLFNNDASKIYEIIVPQDGIPLNENAKNADLISINRLYEKTKEYFPEQEIVMANFHHYGKKDANVSFYVDDGKTMLGDGEVVYSMQSGEVLAEITPNEKTYSQTVYNLLIKLHFGTFGGLALKIIYFILAMITCYVLISGMMIWKVSRDTKNYSEKQKRFHYRVTKIYLAICLSLFPATALLFIANKAIGIDVGHRVDIVNAIFFIGWLVFMLIGLLFKKYRKLNNFYLILGGLLALLIPIFNGVVTGDWIWFSFLSKQYQVFSVDVFWLLTGIAALIGYWKFGKQNQNKLSSRGQGA